MVERARGAVPTRTFALAGHRSSGKTTVGDLLLHTAGVTRTLGRVDEATSLLDHEAEERRRRMTLAPSFAWMEWRGHRLYLADTPGSDGLAHEQALVLSGVDGVLVVVDGTRGVELGAQRALEEAQRLGLPRMVVIHRMDRPCDVGGVLDELEAAISDAKVIPLQIPCRDESGVFFGVVELLGRRCLRYTLDGSGHFEYEQPALRHEQIADQAWERLVEAIALTEDGLLERYLDELDLGVEEVRRGVRRATLSGRVVPVVYTSGSAAIGGEPLLDACLLAFPDANERRSLWAIDGEGADVPVVPAESGFVAQHLTTRLDADSSLYRVFRVWSGRPPARFAWTHGESGQVARVQKLYELRGPRAAAARFKGPGALVATWDPLPSRPGDTWTDGPRIVIGAPPPPPPMVAWALVPTEATNEERLREALVTLQELDPALEVRSDELTWRPVVAGASQEQIDRALELLHSRFGIFVRTHLPTVSYRETPVVASNGVEGVHRRTVDGEVVEFGSCVIDLIPDFPGEDYIFLDGIEDNDLVKRFVPAIEEGVRRGLERGPLGGYPVVGVEVKCSAGELDILESTDEHFVLAGERAIRFALERSGTRILEPWHRFDVRTPAEHVGPILSELGARRGRIQGLEVNGSVARVFGEAPYRELRTLGPRLQVLTAGRGLFSSAASHYDVLPSHLVKDAIAASPFATS